MSLSPERVLGTLLEVQPAFAVYGAGNRARELLGHLLASGLPMPVVILDDIPRTASLGGVPVRTPEEASGFSFDTILLGTDTFQVAMRKRIACVFGSTKTVRDVFATAPQPPSRFPYHLFRKQQVAFKCPDGKYPFLVWLMARAGINPERPIIFDVGANRGQSAEQMIQVFPTAQVFCFEPLPTTFRQLCATASQLNAKPPFECRTFNLALSDREGTATFYTHAISAIDSLLPKIDPTFQDRETTVTCTTLSAFCTAHKISHINLLKVDVQGAERLVFAGATDMLHGHAIDFIVFEARFQTPYAYKGEAKLWELASNLETLGYRFVTFVEMLHNIAGILQETDVVFCRSDYYDSLWKGKPNS